MNDTGFSRTFHAGIFVMYQGNSGRHKKYEKFPVYFKKTFRGDIKGTLCRSHLGYIRVPMGKKQYLGNNGATVQVQIMENIWDEQHWIWTISSPSMILDSIRCDLRLYPETSTPRSI